MPLASYTDIFLDFRTCLYTANPEVCTTSRESLQQIHKIWTCQKVAQFGLELTFLQDAGVQEDGLLYVETVAGVAVCWVADARVKVWTGLQNGQVNSTVATLPWRTRVNCDQRQRKHQTDSLSLSLSLCLSFSFSFSHIYARCVIVISGIALAIQAIPIISRHFTGLTENDGHEIDGPSLQAWNWRTWKWRTWNWRTRYISFENRLHYNAVCNCFQYNGRIQVTAAK